MSELKNLKEVRDLVIDLQASKIELQQQSSALQSNIEPSLTASTYPSRMFSPANDDENVPIKAGKQEEIKSDHTNNQSGPK